MIQTGEFPRLDQPFGTLAGNDYIPVRSALSFRTDPTWRNEHRVVVYSADGKLVEAWTQWDHLFGLEHRIAINPYDPERSVWILDNANRQIFKFSNDGKKLLQTWGEKLVTGGTDGAHFIGPNGIAFFPNGDFVVADGSSNGRVAKFSKDGKYLMQWGKPAAQNNWPKPTPPLAGRDPSALGDVHAIGVDAKQRVYAPGGTRALPSLTRMENSSTSGPTSTTRVQSR